MADIIAGARAHERKLAAARWVRESGIALSVNVVLHRGNIDAAAGNHRVRGLARRGAAGTGQRAVLRLGISEPRAVAAHARAGGGGVQIAMAAKERLAGKMEMFYVLPDYYEARPKPCMNGWGRRYLTVNPVGDVLPCPTAAGIPGLRFENVREQSLGWIWNESESFNRFRGTEWMPEPCRRCPQHEIDFGGCRCQAALLTGDAANTDPVCTLTPDRVLVDRMLAQAGRPVALRNGCRRQNPVGTI